jgi:hypothetical protein
MRMYARLAPMRSAVIADSLRSTQVKMVAIDSRNTIT